MGLGASAPLAPPQPGAASAVGIPQVFSGEKMGIPNDSNRIHRRFIYETYLRNSWCWFRLDTPTDIPIFRSPTFHMGRNDLNDMIHRKKKKKKTELGWFTAKTWQNPVVPIQIWLYKTIPYQWSTGIAAFGWTNHHMKWRPSSHWDCWSDLRGFRSLFSNSRWNAWQRNAYWLVETIWGCQCSLFQKQMHSITQVIRNFTALRM